MELVVRLHAHLRERGESYRITFVPEPTCWTEAPEDFKTLSTQRRRWQRGLGQTLWRHRRLMANPRYGSVGLLALPCFLIFEFLAPALEALGIVVVILAVAVGAVSLSFLAAFSGVSLLIWILLSFAAVLLEEYAVRRYARGLDIVRLVYYSVFESIGYRQLNALWRCQGLIDLARKKQGWGHHAAARPGAPDRGAAPRDHAGVARRPAVTAEREGFEPSNEVNPRYAISSRARSTAPAPLQAPEA
jgi:glycosyl transferase family 2